MHLKACQYIPDDLKTKYKSLLDQNHQLKKPQKYVKAYYAEAARELGLVDTPDGLFFGSAPNSSGTPSERLGTLIGAASCSDHTSREQFWEAYSAQISSSRKDHDGAMQMKKFEHVASESTRDTIKTARREPTAFVKPHDFPTISDFDFLLFHQVAPCRPTASRLEKIKSIGSNGGLSGLCCKHCARANVGQLRQNGIYYPSNLATIVDSAFSQSVSNHVMTCRNVPQEIKSALAELKHLAKKHGVATKRGSKKQFLTKVWKRMEKYYE